GPSRRQADTHHRGLSAGSRIENEAVRRTYGDPAAGTGGVCTGEDLDGGAGPELAAGGRATPGNPGGLRGGQGLAGGAGPALAGGGRATPENPGGLRGG